MYRGGLRDIEIWLQGGVCQAQADHGDKERSVLAGPRQRTHATAECEMLLKVSDRHRWRYSWFTRTRYRRISTYTEYLPNEDFFL